MNEQNIKGDRFISYWLGYIE